MKTAIIVLLSAVLFLGSLSLCDAACENAQPLFHIERNKNKNIVQYDVCLLANGDLRDENPVIAYWILENGQKEELNSVERKRAYGISSQVRLEKNKFKVILVPLKERQITVQKADGKYGAIIGIDGKPSILEKVYIQAKEKAVGFPTVINIDLFGYDTKTKAPVKERITPKE